MKPKELLYSLDHVGDDLLAQAEQTVLVRKHRPWAGAAAAAVVLVALGVGGFFLWKNLKGGLNPAATGTPSAPAVTRPSADPIITDTMELPILTLGESWKTGAGRVRIDDLEASLAGSRPSEYDLSYNDTLSANNWSLPVYEREGGLRGDPDHLYGEDQLRARLNRATAWIGAALLDEATYQLEEVDGESCVEAITAETDQGTLTVCADGRILMLFDSDHAIESHAKVDLVGGLTHHQSG